MYHVAGCGIDIEELDRFKKIFSNDGFGIPELIRDVFSEEEIARNNEGNTFIKYALGFSCKEAAFKAFGTSWTTGDIFWQDIELLFDENNFEKYEIKLNGYALEYYKDNGYKKIESSILHDDRYAVFSIVLLK